MLELVGSNFCIVHVQKDAHAHALAHRWLYLHSAFGLLLFRSLTDGGSNVPKDVVMCQQRQGKGRLLASKHVNSVGFKTLCIEH